MRPAPRSIPGPARPSARAAGPWRLRAAVGGTALLALLALVACGGDDDGPEAQPAPDVASFAEGGFDALPVPPRSEPVGERSEDGDVVARSWTVRGSTVDDVLGFYATALDGWRHEGTTDVGTAVRSLYTRDGRGLRVTAQPAPAVGSGTVDGDEAVVQLSLQLGPPDVVLAG